MTRTYMTVYSSSREPLYEHISGSPVVGIGHSDGEMGQVPEDQRCLRSTACIESLSSVVVLVTAMSRPWVWPRKESFCTGRACCHHWLTVSGSCLTAETMSKDPSTSNTPTESSTPAPALSDANIERLLNREASAIQRELEVDRIFNAFKLKSVSISSPSCLYLTVLFCSPYDILDLEPSVTTEGVKKKYRQLSLCELPLSTRNVELCSLMRDFLYVFND